MSYNNFNNWIEIFKIKSLSIYRTPMLFFILLLSFCLGVIRKGLRNNSEIFVNLRRSSGQPMRERSDRWPLFLVFKSVPGCTVGIPGHYGMLRGIMGCSRGVPGIFWAVPVVFRGCSGVFRGCSGVFRGVPGVFRVLQTPRKFDNFLRPLKLSASFFWWLLQGLKDITRWPFNTAFITKERNKNKPKLCSFSALD